VASTSGAPKGDEVLDIFVVADAAEVVELSIFARRAMDLPAQVGRPVRLRSMDFMVEFPFHQA
jgi:hypothetical protein